MPQYQSLSQLILPAPGPRRWIALVLFLGVVLPVGWFVAGLILPLPPGARYGNAAAVLEGRIYVTGGFGRGVTEARVDSFNPLTGRWRREPDLRNPRGFHGAAVLDGRMYVVGGLAEGGESNLSSVEVFDPERGAWETGPALPRAINRLAVTQSSNAIFAVGGMATAEGDLGSIYVLRSGSQAWDTLASMPTRRHGAAAAAFGGALYVVGGYSMGQVSDRLEILELDRGTWSRGEPIEVARGFAGLQAVGDRLYLFGGRVRERRVITEVYDAALQQWTPAASIPEWRDRFASVTLGGLIYLIGGEASFGACCGRTVLVYDAEKDHWSEM